MDLPADRVGGSVSLFAHLERCSSPANRRHQQIDKGQLRLPWHYVSVGAVALDPSTRSCIVDRVSETGDQKDPSEEAGEEGGCSRGPKDKLSSGAD